MFIELTNDIRDCLKYCWGAHTPQHILPSVGRKYTERW